MSTTPLLRPDSVLHDVPTGARWRWQARRILLEIRDLLAGEVSAPYDGWLAARGGRVLRERDLLLRRLGHLSVLLDTAPDAAARAELRRLLADVERHRQRERDLHWDEVELELGGSE